LNDRGLAGASSTLKKLYDINGAVGGPIKQDKVWFYVTSRYFTNEAFLAGRFFPVDPTAVQRQNDTSRQAYAGTYTYDNNGRITWGINDKQKSRVVRIVQRSRWSCGREPVAEAAPSRPGTTASTTKWTHCHQPAAVRGGHRGRREV
jgi:hypothetical protein